ncbi:MAG TPA: hypothetical protein VED87_05655 [Methylocystis sp.]|nr:hypothetical protein [Methylocystis sp.]
MDKKPKRPRDPAQLAKEFVDLVTMDDADREALAKKLAQKQQKSSKGHSIPGKRGSLAKSN